MKTFKFIFSILVLIFAAVAFVYASNSDNSIDQSGFIMIFFICVTIFGGVNYILSIAYPGAVATMAAVCIFLCELSGIAHPVNELMQWIS